MTRYILAAAIGAVIGAFVVVIPWHQIEQSCWASSWEDDHVACIVFVHKPIF